jgi:hypothetical protein
MTIHSHKSENKIIFISVCVQNCTKEIWHFLMSHIKSFLESTNDVIDLFGRTLLYVLHPIFRKHNRVLAS